MTSSGLISAVGATLRALEMAQGAPGGAVFGAVGLDWISELHERDLGGAHQMRSDRRACRARERRFGRAPTTPGIEGGSSARRPDGGRCVRRRRRSRAIRPPQAAGRARPSDAETGAGGRLRRDRRNRRRRRGRIRGSRQGSDNRRDDKRRRMPPDLQQKRAAADSRDERRQPRADVGLASAPRSPVPSAGAPPRARRPQQRSRFTNAYEDFDQASFPQ